MCLYPLWFTDLHCGGLKLAHCFIHNNMSKEGKLWMLSLDQVYYCNYWSIYIQHTLLAISYQNSPVDLCFSFQSDNKIYLF